MSLSSPHEGWPPAEDASDMGFVHRKSAMGHAKAHLQQAYQLETTKGSVYVTSAAIDTPLENAHAILLTRDGQTPQFEEAKERLYLFFPPPDIMTEAGSELPMLWVEHITAEGDSRRFILTIETLEPYFGGDWESFLAEESETLAYLRATQTADENHLSERYRDLIKELRLTPQVYNPFDR